MNVREGYSDGGADGSTREVSIQELLAWLRVVAAACWTRRRMFMWTGVVAVGIALLYILGSNREYIVTTKIIPYRSEPSPLGGLSGLAGLAGVSLPLSTTGQVVPAELYPEVVNSFSFRSVLALRPIHFSDGRRSYATYYDSVYTPSPVELLVKYSLELPLTAYEAIRAALAPMAEGRSTVSLALDSLGVRSYSPRFVEIVDGLGKRVRTVSDKKTGVISITVRMPDPAAAADLARLTAEQLTNEIVRYESTKASEQARFLREQQEAAERRYQRAQEALAEFQDRNKSLISAVRSVERQRLESEFTLSFEIYKSITDHYETARIKQQEDTPLLTVLEPSIVPTIPDSPRKMRIILLAAILGGGIALARVLWGLQGAAVGRTDANA